MRNALKPLFVLALLTAAVSHANAASAVNTGTPASSDFPLSVDGTDWLAGQVSFTAATKITSIQAYLNDLGSGGDFTIALYADSSKHLPGTLLNSWNASFATASGASDWNGVSNLAYTVAAGTYWVALEVQGNNSFSGVAPITPPNPLAKYAFNDGGYSGYQAMSQSFGVQVATVPEADTYAMLIAGLGLIAAVARRKTR